MCNTMHIHYFAGDVWCLLRASHVYQTHNIVVSCLDSIPLGVYLLNPNCHTYWSWSRVSQHSNSYLRCSSQRTAECVSQHSNPVTNTQHGYMVLFDTILLEYMILTRYNTAECVSQHRNPVNNTQHGCVFYLTHFYFFKVHLLESSRSWQCWSWWYDILVPISDDQTWQSIKTWQSINPLSITSLLTWILIG